MKKGIPATNEIVSFLHCNQCIKELMNDQDEPEDLVGHILEPINPREYAKIEVGYTPMGIQLWCLRHDINIIHIDFNGMKFYANTEGLKMEDADEMEKKIS